MEGVVMRGVNNRLAVNLPSEHRTGLENLAGFLCFGHAHGTGVIGGFIGPLAPVEIEQHDLVTQVAVAGHSPAAAVFGVARMPPGDNHFELGLACVWLP